MESIKKGDIVGRKSYNKDILFVVKRIINTSKGKIALLRGLVERIEADSLMEDLEKISKEQIKTSLREFDNKLEKRIASTVKKTEDRNYNIGIITNNSRTKEKFMTGKILHLDGDKKYSEKSYRYYKKLGLHSVVKNIPEYKQPKVVYNLLKIYNPDILVITGHDRHDKKWNWI